MPRTNSPSLSVYGYTVTSYVNTGGTGNITFNLALSAETSSNLVNYLSGNATVATPLLSGTLAPTALSTLSATSTGIFLRWPTIYGNSDFYGYVASSTVQPGVSATTFVIDFNAAEFTNTIFYLSGNKASVIVDYPGAPQSTIDNPFYDIKASITSPYMTTNTFRTVGEHLRRWNVNG